MIPVWKTNKCERDSETESERVVVRVVGTSYDSYNNLSKKVQSNGNANTTNM